VSAAAPKAAEARIDGIRGLRALAVLSVVLFHVDPAWLPGGFVGVDVFFVISGFIVAHSVHGARDEGFRRYFLWFYRRRFLRILPAIYLYVAVAVLAGILFIPTTEATRFIELTGVASLFGASNFALLWKAGDYFAASSEFNTFTHTWSLAVEEQYYLLFPIFSYLVIVRAGSRMRGWAIALVWAACLASLLVCAWATGHWRAFAFYMLPTRFWELGIGFLLRVHGPHLNGRLAGRATGPVADALAGLATAALLLAFWFTPSGAFPFPGAIWACTATLVLIGCVWLAPGTLAGRLMEWRPLMLIGDISYSLYLWHWGVVVLMRWTIGLDTLPLRLLALALMTLLAILSYLLVERPLRYDRRLLALGTPAFFAVYAAAGVLVAGLSGALVYAKPRVGLSASNDALVWSPYVLPPADPACPVASETVPLAGGWRVDFRPACARANGPRLFVIGDSHAGAYQRLAYRLAAQQPIEVHLYTLSGCRLVELNSANASPACAPFQEAARADILSRARAGDSVLLTALYTPRYRDEWGAPVIPGAAPAPPAAIDHAVATLAPFRAHGLSIVLEAPKPTIPTALFRCADWFNRSNGYCAPGWSVPRAEMEQRRARPLAAIRAVAARLPGVRVWDPMQVLCSPRRCEGFRGGKPLYFDTDHLSGYGNEVLLPSVRALLAAPAKQETHADHG
jgi:peptidoglycan/LPS O-acetylase OafA/YrhL